MSSAAVVACGGLIRRRLPVQWYIASLSVLGALVSGWHNLIERGHVDESSSCAASGPSCALPCYTSLGEFGYGSNGEFTMTGLPVTLATMAFAGFLLLAALALLPEALPADGGETPPLG